MSTDVTSANFQSEVLNHHGQVLVDFWAPWCGPCQMLGPIIEEIASELKNRIKVVKVNVDDAPDIAASLNVSSIPTVILFDNGKSKQTWIGFRQKQEFLTAIALK